MTISVIVPVYDNPDGLRRCLASLARLDDPEFEIIVVDDGSPSHLGDICAAAGARMVRLPENAGPGAARNAGAAQARGEILAFTDSDCAVPRDWLRKIRESLAAPDVVAVAGTFAESLGADFIGHQRLSEARFYHVKERCIVNSFVTANFAVRTAVFREVGGFPPLRIGEDLIFGYRMRERGYGVLWRYDLEVAQEFRTSFRAYFRQQRAWMGHLLLLTFEYPGLHGMKWSVERRGLMGQIGLQALLLAALPFARPTAEWAAGLALGGGVLGVMNGPFLRHCWRTVSPRFALQVFLTTVLLRNTSWLVGIASTLLRHPVRAVPGVARLLAANLGAVLPRGQRLASPAIGQSPERRIGRSAEGSRHA